MCKNCKFMLPILVAVSVFQLSKSSDLQHLVDRLDNIELILNGGKYTWEDINKLKNSIEGLEERLNLTAIDTEYLLSRVDLLESLENSIAQLTDFKLQTEVKLESISHSLQSLKEELENEVALSVSTRQHVSELDDIVRSLTNHGDDDQVDEAQLPLSCLDALKNGQTMSGEYTVQPECGWDPIKVCTFFSVPFSRRYFPGGSNHGLPGIECVMCSVFLRLFGIVLAHLLAETHD